MRLFDSLTKQISFVFLASMIVNVSNYLFHIYMSRSLGPADYGILASLFSLLMIISVPAGTLQTVVTKYTSNFKAHKELAKIKTLLIGLFKRIFLFGLGGFVLFILARRYIASFLQISTTIPVIILGIALMLAIVSPLLLGVLQGLQKFGYFAVTGIIGTLAKLLFGILLVYLGWKVNGAVLGLTLGGLAGILFAIIPLRPIIKQHQSDCDFNLPQIYGYFFPVAAMLLCLMILTNVDIVLVKHFYSPSQAGNYAAASILAKIIFYLPGAIGMVMFPKTSELHALGEKSMLVLKKSLLYGVILCGGTLVLYLTIPAFVVKVLFGKQYSSIIPLMGIFGSAMFFFSLANILFLYQLSVHRLKFLWILIIGTLLEIALIVLFHTSLLQVILILLIVGLFLFLSSIYYVFLKSSDS